MINVIRQGQVVILTYLNVVNQKKLALILKTKIRNVSNIVFNALFSKSMRRTIQKE